MTEFRTFLTVDLLRDALQSAGYRANDSQGPDNLPVVLSATNGLPFEARLLNPLPNETGAFADASFRTAFRIQGELPLILLNAWNVGHRFGRLVLLAGPGESVDRWLVLEMDLVALGGVAHANLRVHIDIWDGLVTELVSWLRAELPRFAKAAPVAEPHAVPADPARAIQPATV